jgi:hypothetical protein
VKVWAARFRVLHHGRFRAHFSHRDSRGPFGGEGFPLPLRRKSFLAGWPAFSFAGARVAEKGETGFCLRPAWPLVGWLTPRAVLPRDLLAYVS